MKFYKFKYDIPQQINKYLPFFCYFKKSILKIKFEFYPNNYHKFLTNIINIVYLPSYSTNAFLLYILSKK